jgi:hypothetical protein
MEGYLDLLQALHMQQDRQNQEHPAGAEEELPPCF